MPYTVSVGSTTSSPRRTAAAAAQTGRRRASRPRCVRASHRSDTPRHAYGTRSVLARADRTGSATPGAVHEARAGWSRSGWSATSAQPPVARERPGHLPALGVGVLDDDHPAGPQQPRGGAFARPADRVRPSGPANSASVRVVVARPPGRGLRLRAGCTAGCDTTTSTLPSSSANAVGQRRRGRRSHAAVPAQVALRPSACASGQLHGVHRRAGTSCATASAIAPEPGAQVDDDGRPPTPRSREPRLSPSRPRTSVSGRGTKTPGPTASSR